MQRSKNPSLCSETLTDYDKQSNCSLSQTAVKALVISGSAGVGKTELAKRYSNVLDLDCSAFSKSPDWPRNYIEAINENLYKYDYILVFTKLQDLDLDYVFCFPSKDAIPEYEGRLAKRGGMWVDVARSVYSEYDKHLKTAQGLGKDIFFLGKGETLESFLLQNQDKYPRLIARE